MRATYSEHGNSRLWRYDRITGYWKYLRDVHESNARDWLRVYQSDEPGETFAIRLKRPTAAPVAR